MTKELLLCRKENRIWYEYHEFSTRSFGLNALLKVPPPRKFSRPVGGAGSVAIHMESVPKNRFQSVDSTASSPEPTIPRLHRQEYPKPIFGKVAEKESRSSTRPSRAIHRQSTLRGFSKKRAAQLVRSFILAIRHNT